MTNGSGAGRVALMSQSITVAAQILMMKSCVKLQKMMTVLTM